MASASVRVVVARSTLVEAGGSTSAVQHGKLSRIILKNDLGGVAVLSPIILPFARLQLAFQVNFRTLLQKLLRHFAQGFIVNDHAVPLGALFALAALLVPPAFRS